MWFQPNSVLCRARFYGLKKIFRQTATKEIDDDKASLLQENGV